MKESNRPVASPSTTVLIILTATSLLMVPTFVLAEPRTQTVSLICGPNHMNNATLVVPNFITTMASIGNQVNNAARFAVASAGSGVNANYALYQCYGDLSQLDCELCHIQARTVLPTCAPSNDGRIFLDGCFMRSATYRFFEEWTGPLDKVVCGGNGTRELTVPGFDKATRRAVRSAVAGAAGRNGYARGKARGSGVNGSAFGLANCWGTLNATSCRACLEAASGLALGCLPWSEGRALKTGCFLRYSNVDFLNPEQPNGSSKGGTRIVAAVIVASCVAVLIVGGTLGFYMWRRGKLLNRRGFTDVKKLAKILRDSNLNFEFSTLQRATASFSDANKLGQGGFGTVYKGTLADGREIAVKRLFFNNRHNAAEFFNEVNIISSVVHQNLVRLLGCSISGPDSLLVYEFMPNNSLDQYIFDPDKGKTLGWEKRYEIIKGTAEGLVYLHENNKIKILHRDIKASNILLDSRLRPKIADFGLARSLQDGKSHISTAIAGTLGYMAPEYLAHGQLTEKADVYSFGVLLLEIATGRRNCDGIKSYESLESLVITVWKDFQEGTVEKHFDPNLMPHSYNDRHIKEDLLRVMHIGLLCTQENPSLRPTMSKALQMLETKNEILPAPSNPPFMDEQKMEFNHSSEDPSHSLISTSSSNPLCSDASMVVNSHSTFYPR